MAYVSEQGRRGRGVVANGLEPEAKIHVLAVTVSCGPTGSPLSLFEPPFAPICETSFE